MPNETTIPADALAGLLDGTPLRAIWRTPPRYGIPEHPRDGSEVVIVGEVQGRGETGAQWVEYAYCGSLDSAPVMCLHLNCLRPEVQAHIGRVLAAGARCEACGGRGSVQASVQPGCDGECPGPCGCDAGWTRKPSPIWHILDASRTNALSNQHIAEAVAWSVRSAPPDWDVVRLLREPNRSRARP